MTTPVVTNWKKEWFEIEDAIYLNVAAHAVIQWDWAEPARWICETSCYVEGQTRREISQYRNSTGRPSGAGDS
jgi:hypothetical protein